MTQREIDNRKELIEFLAQSDFPDEVIDQVIKSKIGLEPENESEAQREDTI